MPGTFLPNIPAATDIIAVSQGNIQNNFQVLGAIAGNGTAGASYSINSSAGFNWIYLPPQGVIPPASSSFPTGNIGLYSANNGITDQNELWINKQNGTGGSAVTVQVPATASILGITPAPGNASSGWSYLPSGILIQWGIVTGVVRNTVNGPYNFPIAFPNACFSIVGNENLDSLPSQSNLNTAICIGTLTSSTFQVFPRAIGTPSGSTVNIYYFAIGN